MKTIYTYDKYRALLNDYFKGEFREIYPFGQKKSMKLFRKVVKDYYHKKIDMKIVGLVAAKLYWNLNDHYLIDNQWNAYLSSALWNCNEAAYIATLAEGGDKKSQDRIKQLKEKLRTFVKHT